MSLAEQIEAPFRSVLIGMVRFYQHWISRFLPPSCRFYPSCSNYAIEALHKRRLLKALAMIAWRVVRCNPLNAGGFDPVDKSEAKS